MSVETLKKRLMEAEETADYYYSLVQTFFSGDIPSGASVEHFIIAKWGRRRLEEMKSQPSLLRSE